MPGNGEHRARERDGQAEVHNILYILKRGEAQRDRDGVNYSVKAVVKIRILPGSELHQQELSPLLDNRDNREGEDYFIIFIVLAHLVVEYLFTYHFEHYRHQRRNDTHENQRQQQPGRLLVDRVVLIDIAQQKHRGQYCREDIY